MRPPRYRQRALHRAMNSPYTRFIVIAAILLLSLIIKIILWLAAGADTPLFG
jgi:hypothetical protein